VPIVGVLYKIVRRPRHPDEASNASGRKDLGQLRASEAGSGFEIAERTFAE
jgi:hypothetical protein